MPQPALSTRVRRLPFRRPPLVALAGSVVCALAAWVSLGVMAVAADASSARIALLPPLWLPLAIGVALLALAAWGPVPERAWWPALVPSVLLLPWLPVAVPAVFLVWTGPIAALVWAVTAIAVAAAWRPGRPEFRFARRPSVHQLGLVAFAASLAVYAAAAWSSSPSRPAGDEPNYLIITQSLLLDGDLQIENNHTREDYVAYYSADLRPDYLRRGKNKQIYSIHAPGLPALVVPAFAVGGYPAVVAFLVLVSALGAWLVWRTSYLLAGHAGAAFFGWAAVCLSVPFLCHSGAVFPDGPGAVLVMTGVAALVRLDDERRAGRLGEAALPSARAWLLHGLALALLPWLHTRFAAAAGVLGACIGFRLIAARRWRELAAFAVVPVLSALAWFGFFQAIYGSFDPASPYGSYSQSSLRNLWPGLPALLLDQQYGLLPNAPVYVTAFAGLGVLFTRRRRLAIEVAVLILVYLSAVASYGMWWGGWSAPARFAVPVLLALGPCCAVYWEWGGRSARAAGLVSLAVSLLIAAVFSSVAGGQLMFNPRDGVARWLEWISPVVDLPRGLPSFFWTGPWPALADAAAWALTIAVGWLVLHLLLWPRHPGNGRASRDTMAVVGAPLLFFAAVTVGCAIVWAVHGNRGVAPTSGQLRLLAAFDPAALPHAVQFRPLRARRPPDLLPRLRVSVSERRPLPPAAPMLAVRGLPAGVYRVLRADASAPRHLAIRMSSGSGPLQECAFEPRQPECLVWLPVNARELRVEGIPDGQGTASPAPGRAWLPRAIELQPLDVLAARERPTQLRASAAERYGSVSVFAFDNLVFLEPHGLWVQGGADVPLVIGSAEAANSVPVLLRNGAHANTITLRAQSFQSDLSLSPGEEREVVLPLDARSRAIFLQVRAKRGFKPSEVDRSSRDERYLGVWIQPR